MNIEIESYWELLALHKSLMAVKFDQNPSFPEAQGSPYTGSLAFKVFDQLVISSSEQKAKGWNEWQVADDARSETKLLRRRIAESEWWLGAAQDKKESYIRDFMAPLVLNKQAFNDIIKNC